MQAGEGRASLSLEGIFTGASLWLAYIFLMGDNAEANGWPREPEESRPLAKSDGDEGSGGGNIRRPWHAPSLRNGPQESPIPWIGSSSNISSSASVGLLANTSINTDIIGASTTGEDVIPTAVVLPLEPGDAVAGIGILKKENHGASNHTGETRISYARGRNLIGDSLGGIDAGPNPNAGAADANSLIAQVGWFANEEGGQILIVSPIDTVPERVLAPPSIVADPGEEPPSSEIDERTIVSATAAENVVVAAIYKSTITVGNDLSPSLAAASLSVASTALGITTDLGSTASAGVGSEVAGIKESSITVGRDITGALTGTGNSQLQALATAVTIDASAFAGGGSGVYGFTDSPITVGRNGEVIGAATSIVLSQAVTNIGNTTSESKQTGRGIEDSTVRIGREGVVKGNSFLAGSAASSSISGNSSAAIELDSIGIALTSERITIGLNGEVRGTGLIGENNSATATSETAEKVSAEAVIDSKGLELGSDAEIAIGNTGSVAGSGNAGNVSMLANNTNGDASAVGKFEAFGIFGTGDARIQAGVTAGNIYGQGTSSSALTSNTVTGDATSVTHGVVAGIQGVDLHAGLLGGANNIHATGVGDYSTTSAAVNGVSTTSSDVKVGGLVGGGNTAVLDGNVSAIATLTNTVLATTVWGSATAAAISSAVGISGYHVRIIGTEVDNPTSSPVPSGSLAGGTNSKIEGSLGSSPRIDQKAIGSEYHEGIGIDLPLVGPAEAQLRDRSQLSKLRTAGAIGSAEIGSLTQNAGPHVPILNNDGTHSETSPAEDVSDAEAESTEDPSVPDAEAGRQELHESLPAQDSSLAVAGAIVAQIPLPAPTELVVSVTGEASIVSRGVEDSSRVMFRTSQAGISEAMLDLREGNTTAIRVNSERLIHALAFSTLADADLEYYGQNAGLSEAILLSDDDTSSISIRVVDDLIFGLSAALNAHTLIRNLTLGMDAAEILDQGGLEHFYLSSLANLSFTGLGNPESSGLAFELTSQGISNSTIRLANADNSIIIDSGFTKSLGEEAGIAFSDFLPTLSSASPGRDAAAEETTAHRLHASFSVVGAAYSLIDSGEGNDYLAIRTYLDDAALQILANLSDIDVPEITSQRVALLDSVVLMGEGNDELSVNGAVIGSLLDLGSGSNILHLEGPIQDSIVLLSPGSLTAIELGESDDSLSVRADGAAELHAKLGDGSDLLELCSSTITGVISGGEGIDTIQLCADPESYSSGEGANLLTVNASDGGFLDGLSWEGFEQVALGSGKDMVVIDPKGDLMPRLQSITGELNGKFTSSQISLDLVDGSLGGQLLGESNLENYVFEPDTLRIDGGNNEDLFLLDWTPFASGVSWRPELNGGPGLDTFLIALPEDLASLSLQSQQVLPRFVDVEIKLDPLGGIGLTDQIAWLHIPTMDSENRISSIHYLTPTGISGIGDPSLLPMAPIDQLLAGISITGGLSSQLAIAMADHGSQLLLINQNGSYFPIVDLPAILSNAPYPSPSTYSATSLSGPA